MKKKKKAGKYILIGILFILTGTVLYAVGEVDTTAKIGAATYYFKKAIGVIKGGMYVSGGGISLFGFFQLIMAYLQSNPTAYADAVKKIVAGGMLIALGAGAELFIMTDDDVTEVEKDTTKIEWKMESKKV